MTIHYQDGRTAEAIIRSLTEDIARLKGKGSEDTEVFTKVSGTWVSEDCEPVRLTLGKVRPSIPARFSDEDLIDSAALASRLIDLMLNLDEMKAEPT